MLSQNATTRNSLLQVSRVITIRNYEKHALRVSRVIAVLAKSACKHAIFRVIGQNVLMANPIL